MTERELVDDLLRRSKRGTLADLEAGRWLDVQPSFEEAHFLNGFGWTDKRYRFRADWLNLAAPNTPPASMGGTQGPASALPVFPDHAALEERTDAEHPFRLATSPARQFLNSSFAETEGSRSRERRPELTMHAEDAARLGLGDDALVEIGNRRGSVTLALRVSDTVRPGVVIHEGLWPNSAFPGGEGINVLVGADSVAPAGGAAFHDTTVWVRAASGLEAG